MKDFLDGLGNMINTEQAAVSILVILLLLVLGYISYKIFQARDSGRNIIKGLKNKIELIGELLLGGANILEAITTATAAAAEGINFFVRLGIHLLLALFGIAIGFSFFDQVKQAVDQTRYLINYKGNNWILVTIDFIKQWMEALAAIFMAVGIPIINWSFLLIYEDALWGFWSGQIRFFELSPAAQGIGVITGVHIVTVFYLASISYDSLKEFYKESVKEKNFKDSDVEKYVAKYVGDDKDAQSLNADLVKMLFSHHDKASLRRRIQMENLFSQILTEKEVFDAKSASSDDRYNAAVELEKLNKQLEDYIKDFEDSVLKKPTT